MTPEKIDQKELPNVSPADGAPPYVQAERLEAMAEEHAAQPATGITNEERLQLQLTWANMSNVQLQIKLLENDLLAARKLLTEQVAAMQKVREQIIQKYGIDPNNTTIDGEGNFIPITPEMRQAMAGAAFTRF